MYTYYMILYGVCICVNHTCCILNMYNLYCVLLPELCHQVDKLQMTDCFRNGDFVRAQAGEANS